MDADAIHPLVLSGYGLVEAPFERAVDGFGTHVSTDRSSVQVAGVTGRAGEALDHLARRTVPATRLVLVDRGAWAAVLTNGLSGSDFADHQSWATRALGVRSNPAYEPRVRGYLRDAHGMARD